MKRNEIKTCADIAARAFFPYDYFTLFFPDEKQRMDYLHAIIASEYKANRKAAHFLELRDGVKLVGVVQLHAPDYKKPSDLRYLLAGFAKIYKTADKPAIESWLKMDADAGLPCHEMEKEAWYISSLVVDPGYQGRRFGSRMIDEVVIPYVRQHGGSRLCLFTNSEGNCRFYEKLGFRLFHTTSIEHNGRTMGSWSYVKEL